MSKRTKTKSQYEIDRDAAESARIETNRIQRAQFVADCAARTAANSAATAALLLAAARARSASATDSDALDAYETRMSAAARSYQPTDTGSDPIAHTEGSDDEVGS